MPTTETKSVKIRMYRAGTGDFFILKFDNGFNLMIDCGCINVKSKEPFEPFIKDLKNETGGKIDLLVITHEHADHMNGFQYASEFFSDIKIEKLWLAWTEDKEDPLANNLREYHTKVKMALKAAAFKLQSFQGDYFNALFAGDSKSMEKIENQKHFVEVVDELTNLNLFGAEGQDIPTIADILKQKGIIDGNTKIEYLSPGELQTNIQNLTGIRFFVLGPPRDNELLGKGHKAGHGYEKRKEKSQVNFSFIDALTDGDIEASGPFDSHYVCIEKTGVQKTYLAENWRKIEHDWLYSAGALAMRHEKSINNTSLALAIQFTDSGKVLLFPGDAEYGSWESWKKLHWTIESGQVTLEYLLNKTVFYKVGHHMSQNGSGKEHGIEMMIQDDIAAMATLDFKRINSGWLSTMPNDLIGAALIEKTKGRLFFNGNAQDILKNIKTERVSVKSAHEKTFLAENKKFDGAVYIEYEIKA